MKMHSFTTSLLCSIFLSTGVFTAPAQDNKKPPYPVASVKCEFSFGNQVSSIMSDYTKTKDLKAWEELLSTNPGLLDRYVIGDKKTLLMRHIHEADSRLLALFAKHKPNLKLCTEYHGRNCLFTVKDNVEAAKWLLDHGVDPMSKDAHGVYAITYAPRPVAELLIKHGVKLSEVPVDKHNRPLTQLALEAENFGLMDLLFENGYKPDDSLLFDTVGYLPTPARLNYLVSKGLDVQVKNSRGQSLLHRAASATNADLVKALLDHGLDPGLKDNNGVTPLALLEKSLLGKEPFKSRAEKCLAHIKAPPSS